MRANGRSRRRPTCCSAGGVFAIYPEGTRTRDGFLHRGHTGVARLSLRTGTPIVPVGLIGTDEVQPVDKRMPRLFRRVTVRFGEPLDPARYGDFEQEHLALRVLTDEMMYEIGQLSGYEYVDTYATKKAEDIPVEVAHVASFDEAHPRDRRFVSVRLRPRPDARHRRDGRSPRFGACCLALPAAAIARRRGARSPCGASRSAGSIAGENDASACQVAFTVAGESHTPSAMPARKAAPSAVVSCTAARRTGTPSRSAWNWQQQVHHRRAAVDPHLGGRGAARRGHRVDDVGRLERHRLHDGAGEVRAAGAAGDARGSCPARTGPTTGDPSPVNAGTTYTPPVSGTDAASGPISAASAMIPRPSRSHWTAAPVTKIAPSSA